MFHILKYQNSSPSIDTNVFIATNVCIIGKVHIKKNVSIWYNSVLRGDVGEIHVNEGTNIQDNSVIHVDRNHGNTIIGKMVTIGHNCILHACTIEDNVFIGMGSIVMDNVVMEKNSMLAAGSLVSKNVTIKSNQLWMGRPAKFFRNLSESEISHIQISADNYIKLSQEYINNNI